MPNMVLGAGDTAENKEKESLSSQSLHLMGKGRQ